MIGGIPDTQEMLDFCAAEHSIVADIGLIRGDQINEAQERMIKGDVKYRFRHRQRHARRLSSARRCAATPPG